MSKRPPSRCVKLWGESWELDVDGAWKGGSVDSHVFWSQPGLEVVGSQQKNVWAGQAVLVP